MATLFDKNQVMPGLPPAHLLDGSYKPVIPNLLEKEEVKSFKYYSLTQESNLIYVSYFLNRR